MPLAMANAPCAHCLGRGVSPFDKILRLAVFDDPIKQLVYQIKYHNRWPLAEMLTDRLLETERAKGLLTETQILVPVPLHIRRHISRGYNQADVIARRMGKTCRIPVVNAIKRVRNTETQTHMTSHAKRVDNVRGAFALRRRASALEGKHVVLVDDVMTTGSTLQSVGRLLRQANPRSLCAIVLAIADPKHRGFEVI
jgi:ComF family protein